MDNNEYIKLRKELQELSKNIPLHWGSIQNNKTDSKINMFNFKTIDQLESAINHLEKDHKNYFEIWKIALPDQMLQPTIKLFHEFMGHPLFHES